MAEFDEKKYKEEHGYDALYDAYMNVVVADVKSDPRGYCPTEYKDALPYLIFNDKRVANDFGNLQWKMGHSPIEDKKESDKVKSLVNDYCIISRPESDELSIFWTEMNQEKAASESEFKDQSGNNPDIKEGETVDDISTDKDASTTLIKEQKEKDTAAIAAAEDYARKMYMSWDPRLHRLDAFMFNADKIDDAIRVPFASNTVATAFADLNFTVEKIAAEALVHDGGHTGLYIAKFIGDKDNRSKPADSNESSTNESTNTKQNQNKSSNPNKLASLRDGDRVIVNDPNDFAVDPINFGVASIVNPYSLTKLVGGLGNVTQSGAINYMYDIRDRRRFYGVTVADNDVLAISNPTITQLIEWSNKDAWGRTPYSFQDFVFCKYFGLIPNNRLLTLRRYAAPTYDNLQFEQMYGDIETADGKFNENNKEPNLSKPFAPHATVVSYFGGDTGNTLKGIMNFSTGINWTDIQAKIHEVGGDDGTDPVQKIDELFDKGNCPQGASNDLIDSVLKGGSMVASKIMSYGKFALSLNSSVGKVTDDQHLMQLYGANVDPYEGGIYQNRVLGPLNRIDSVKKRDKGIHFSQQLTVKCSYQSKAIGGINPKAAILDVLGNCMEMVSPTAVFWGGGHKFMIKPHTYPYHDKGWRDSFMKKIYDGDFLGAEGAIAMALSGVKKVSQNADTGEFSWETIQSNLGSVLGDGLAMLGGAISSVTEMFNIDSNFLNNAADKLMGVDGQSAEADASVRAAAKGKVSNLLSNLQTMWKSKMVKESTLPQITGMAALLIGEPVGEWHLTVGNPLNPIMVIGNLICEKMDVDWDEEIGPDDFPTGFTVTYTLQHGMARDKDAIQSMFNRGMGKFYTLPDYMQCSSDRVTGVDKFTKDGGSGDVDNDVAPWMSPSYIKSVTSEYGTTGYQQRRISAGTVLSNHGNPDTQLITKFNTVESNAVRTVGMIRNLDTIYQAGNLAMIKSLAATRKFMS